MNKITLSGIGLLALLVTSILATDPEGKADSTQTNAEPGDNLIAVAPPPFSEGIFPCSECHFPEDEVDTTPREVDFHETVNFEHAEESRWCLDCHDENNRDMLHLADGRLIPFEESYRLCGQCHAQQKRDWDAGDHGRRSGYWSGQKEYLLCAHCHDPHSPSIKPIEPMPAPIRQEKIK